VATRIGRKLVTTWLMAALAALLVGACDRSSSSSSSSSSPAPGNSVAPQAAPSVAPWTPPSVAAAPSPPPSAALSTVGEASLVVERVVRESECGHDVLGFDVLVETKRDGEAKAVRRPLFCPPGKKDMFGMCSHFQRCAIDGAGGINVTCDGKSIVLQVDGSGTVASGGDASIEVTKAPLRVLSATSRTRKALVDC
jgi:hypothetical protein